MAKRDTAPPFVSDREHEVLEALSRLATSNPFLPDRTTQEARALGDDFVPYAAVWSADGELQGINPNLGSLRQLAEQLAEDLRQRLRSGARATPAQLELYEGFVRYLFFYRYEEELTKLVERAEAGQPTTHKLSFFSRLVADCDHFFDLPGVTLPTRPDPGHTLAWGFQIRRAFNHVYWEIYGGSLAMAELRGTVWQSIFTHDVDRYRRRLYDRMADIPTLVLGESGTGKELVARAIGLSRYIPFDTTKQAFVADYTKIYHAVNLSALSSALIESELFGHKRGAFTGAMADRVGWLESSGPHGTIFLDEIGELDAAIQVKLLRVLQSRVYQRIGEVEERRFEGRIVAATNRDLDTELEAGRFREDLYYRLCADVIRMPTLRDRFRDSPDELESLVRVISARVAGEGADDLVDEVVRWIHSGLPADYTWPGNVRELEQCVRSVLVQGRYEPRGPLAGANIEQGGTTIAASILSGQASADDLLREYVTRVYASQGSYEAAARSLGLDRRTVKAKVDRALLEMLTGD